MNRTFKAVVTSLVFGVSFADSAGTAPLADYYATEVARLQPAAHHGDASAQFSLGVMYERGQGVLRDFAAAATWYRKAAEQGHVGAQYNLGVLYWNGWDGQRVVENYVAAANWFRKAAEQGDARAQFNLGIMYDRGQGVPKDDAAAASWWRKAAKQGNGEAQDHLEKIRAAQGRVPLKTDGGTFVVPVQINGTMTLDFVVDSGAADVSVPADVVSTLMRAGAIKDTDFVGYQSYVLADGSKSQSVTFTIRTLKVGNMVLEKVSGSVASAQGSLLLGQSFLKRFKSWSIDNANQELLLEPL
jgi:clan AA aspartic protease (TIGR02281 family)